ncbi:MULTISPECIES: DUF397 domain-containing protein [Streptomyces]|uniref:DUF397 domain-containing protein n=1 Tax=Streptomyces silvae TaxID=2803812 RepID=A0ABU7ZZP5_9ACTN|nr:MULTISPECIES: DUF397 domain-containing protein [unclassified Streptomyces]MDX3430129.1 DUF397 domain-containing protein [Streptomyces sp. ME01-18a]RPK42728.1 hypothetical protein EES40_18110 [Streptomyces sp. ADI93-02]WSS75509.1 DUF397 domain-containing protein [Streptomyces sp. NBC_01174]
MISEPPAGGVHELQWFKSSYSSNSSEADCVEVATTPATVHVRDSKNPPGPRLGFAPATWDAFLAYAAEN